MVHWNPCFSRLFKWLGIEQFKRIILKAARNGGRYWEGRQSGVDELKK